jgi:hypothetical protein
VFWSLGGGEPSFELFIVVAFQALQYQYITISLYAQEKCLQ